MTDVDVKLKIKGIRELLKSAPVQSDLAARVSRAAKVAGVGFDSVVKPAKYTSRAFVQTADAGGARREARDKVLIRTLDAMR